jgi:hypothetical protein
MHGGKTVPDIIHRSSLLTDLKPIHLMLNPI